MTGRGVADVTVRPVAFGETARFNAELDTHHWLGHRLTGQVLRYVGGHRGRFVPVPAAARAADLRRVHPRRLRRGDRPGRGGAGRDKGEAEQVLLDKALKDYGYLFTGWRLWVMDRNFPGVPRIKATPSPVSTPIL